MRLILVGHVLAILVCSAPERVHHHQYEIQIEDVPVPRAFTDFRKIVPKPIASLPGLKMSTSRRISITGNRSMRHVEPPALPSEDEAAARHYAGWQEWLRDLTPDEKVALEKDGLTAPEAPRKGRRAPQRDPEEDPTVGTCDDLASDRPNPYEVLADKDDAPKIDANQRRDLSMLTHILPQIIDAKNPRVVASILALALDIGERQGITIQRLHERHNVGLSWCERKVREWQRNLDLCRVSLTLLRVVISPILASRNPRLEAVSISMAAQFGLCGGASMTALGEHYGVCKAAISARVRRWCTKFNLPLPRDCKQSTENYILSNVRRSKSPTIE